MLRSSKDLEGCAIGATDGTIGEVKDLYFDDEAWVIRYLVVSTGAWLANRKVLISPFALRQPQWALKVLRASLSKEQVKSSPDIDTDKPVSRQHEAQYLKYYRYPAYWGGAAIWGVGPSPNLMPMGAEYDWPAGSYGQMQTEQDRKAETKEHERDDHHLRSCNAVSKYHVHASDGDIGHVAGLLVDDETWAIRYLIVDTSNWWLGHQVLVASQWIREVNWSRSDVSVELTRKVLKEAPPYDATSPLDRGQEIALAFEYYGRPGYWQQNVKRTGRRGGAKLITRESSAERAAAEMCFVGVFYEIKHSGSCARCSARGAYGGQHGIGGGSGCSTTGRLEAARHGDPAAQPAEALFMRRPLVQVSRCPAQPGS